MAPFAGEPGLKIVWGDLTNYADVLGCVTGADYVLHVGGIVSPYADRHPELAMKVNVGAVRNIVQAIQTQPEPDRCRLVYIGTVAQTGDRNPPLHWGRTGDPIFISEFDHYAISKTIAEREVIESGLKHWVSLRQTGIAHPDLFTQNTADPIAFHVPLNGVLEWVTARDSGRLLANVCEEDVPDEFWGRVYNIGGGASWRVINHEFAQQTYATLGIADFRRATEPNWFATRNFHGQWYVDSDVLEFYLRFRGESIGQFLQQLKAHVGWGRWLTHCVPAALIKRRLAALARAEGGSLYWIEHDERDRIEAYFGSREAWRQIPDWRGFQPVRPSVTPTRLDHGYDESKPRTALALEDMAAAARFRGGVCVASSMAQGDLRTKLHWRCAFGHEFEASPTLVLLAGHWCPHCQPAPWNYAAEALRNPFLAQVWNLTSVRRSGPASATQAAPDGP
jgi:nucleoside-diphosphate-sugar epimerase